MNNTEDVQFDPVHGIAEYGRFNELVESRWLPDGRTMVILNHLTYTEPNGKIWAVYPGEKVNGASIPRFFWRVIGSPFVGRFRRPSVFHDVYCGNKVRECAATHRVFKLMMLCDGVEPMKAEAMYRAVKYFGPRW